MQEEFVRLIEAEKDSECCEGKRVKEEGGRGGGVLEGRRQGKTKKQATATSNMKRRR